MRVVQLAHPRVDICDTLKISGSKRVVIWLRRSVKGEKTKINSDLSSSTFFVREAFPGQRLGLGHALQERAVLWVALCVYMC